MEATQINQLLSAFITSLIDTASAAARISYKGKDLHLSGAMFGIECCKKADLTDIESLLMTVNFHVKRAHYDHHEYYWYFRCCQSEIEFIYTRASNYLKKLQS